MGRAKTQLLPSIHPLTIGVEFFDIPVDSRWPAPPEDMDVLVHGPTDPQFVTLMRGPMNPDGSCRVYFNTPIPGAGYSLSVQALWCHTA